MNKEEIKTFLRENINYIENILENLGCKKIRVVKDKRVTASLPDGDNTSSVQVLLNNSLGVRVYTRNEFQKYEVKDIFTLIEYLNECNFLQAIKYVCDICGVSYTGKVAEKVVSSRSVLKKLIKNKKKVHKDIEDEILEESLKQRFIREDCLIYLEDGVESDTQEKFGVSYDVLDNRIVIPIRNDIGELLSFKGRTCDKDYKINGIPKFIFYYPTNSNNYLFGLYENYSDIINNNEIIVVEAEKGVMQLHSMDIKNVVSVNKKTIIDKQIKKLLKLNKDIVLAFDKDVTLEEIYVECKKFKGLCNVYYIYDQDDLLKNKESPTDKGFDVFNKLYTEYKFKFNEEDIK